MLIIILQNNMNVSNVLSILGILYFVYFIQNDEGATGKLDL